MDYLRWRNQLSPLRKESVIPWVTVTCDIFQGNHQRFKRKRTLRTIKFIHSLPMFKSRHMSPSSSHHRKHSVKFFDGISIQAKLSIRTRQSMIHSVGYHIQHGSSRWIVVVSYLKLETKLNFPFQFAIFEHGLNAMYPFSVYRASSSFEQIIF
jgi:hypothetical protein